MMKILGIIPARYASTRFPGKPLVVIDGKTMIQRVYEQAMKCDRLSGVIIATDNEAIFNHVRLFHGNVIMTGTHHATGTERCREVVDKLHLQNEEFDYVINIQGDEPYIKPEQIGQVASCFGEPTTRLVTLVKKINSLEELNSPNTVKAVLDNQGFAMFFSRAVIPFSRGKVQQDLLSGTTYFKHIGIYGYQSSVLKEIVALPVSELERSESLEQLRWLENGYRIKTQITEFESIAIDSPEDLLKITNKTGANHG